MKGISCAFFIAAISGGVSTTAHAQNQEMKIAQTVHAEMVGHIYYNIATGERIVTSINSALRPSDASSSDVVWSTSNTQPCANLGVEMSGAGAVVIDAPNGEMGFDTSEGNTILDWGDIPADTVVDCVQLSYATSIEDTDSDLDSIGDGVEGFAATWAFYDGDNGFDTCFTRQGLVGFTIFGLSGQLDGPGGIGGYIFTLDLADAFASSISFEFGDTDSDLNGAAIHNPGQYFGDIDGDSLPDGDLDGDGLADFAYSLVFIQPGRLDVDNADGDSDSLTGIDGDPNAAGLTGVALGAPEGHAVDNGDGTYSFVTDPYDVPNATGAEEGWDIFDSDGFYDATYSIGPFSCEEGNTTMFSQISLTMLTPSDGPSCPADFTGEGDLDVFDVFAFLAAYEAQDASADLADPIGTFDIFDVFAYLALYEDGCP